MPNAGQVQWHQFARSGRGSQIGLRKNTSVIPTFVHQELLRLQAIRCNLLLLPQFAGGKRQEQAGKNANGELTGVSPARTLRRTIRLGRNFHRFHERQSD
jgi:hypothetical protein